MKTTLWMEVRVHKVGPLLMESGYQHILLEKLSNTFIIQTTERGFSLHLPPAEREDKEHLNLHGEDRKLKQGSQTQRMG